MVIMVKQVRYLIVFVLLLFSTLKVAAQNAMPDDVCVGTTRTYSVNDPTVPSTYTWQINGVTQSTTTNSLTVTWNTVGTYLITVQEHSADGCDGEIQSGYVYVHPLSNKNIDSIVCESALPFIWNGKNIAAAGSYTVTLKNMWGCDSVVTLTLVVNPNVTSSETITICQGQLPYSWNGQSLTQAGAHTATLKTQAGCDSVVTLSLVVNPNVTSSETITICQGQLPYSWNGQSLTQAGAHTATLKTQAGCDSVVTLTLVVNPNVTSSETITICQGQLPYSWNGQSLTQAGAHTATL